MSISIDQLKNKIANLTENLRRKDVVIGTLEDKIELLKNQTGENKEQLYNDERYKLYNQIDHLQTALIESNNIGYMYRQWFKRNAHWTQRFNNMMKYDPTLGNYNRKGADDPIIIPEPEHWKVVKNIPSLSPVAIKEDGE